MADYGGIDPSILLQAKGITLPNPIELAGQGISLANLAGRNQLQQYQLQQQADIPDAMQSIQGITDPEQAAQVLMRDHPRAAQILVPMVRDLAQKAAETQKALAQGQQATAEATNIANKAIANTAYQEYQNPSPTSVARVQYQAKFFGRTLPDVPDPSDPVAVKQWLGGVQAGNITPEQATQMDVNRATVPLRGAETTLANVNAQLAPQKVQAELISARAAAQQAATGQQKFQYGEIVPNVLTGVPSRIAPQITNGQVTGAQGATVTDAQGNPIQTAATLGQAGAIKEQGPIYQQTTKEMAASQRGIQLVDQLMAVAGDKNALSGPLVATDRGRELLGTLSQLGLMTPAMQAKWTNAKGSEVFSQELLGPLVQELGARGGIGLTRLVALGKPGMDVDPAARIQMANNVKQDFQNQIALGQSKLQYMQDHAADDPLALKWQPPPTIAKTPSGKFSATTSMGNTVYFPDEASLRAWQFQRDQSGR